MAAASYMFYYIQREKGLEGSLAYILVNFSDDDSLHFKSMSRLAELLGVSRRAFYYVFSDFVEKGLIEKISNREIKILDKFSLMEIYEKEFLEV